MPRITKYICCGLDRVGKSNLIQNIIRKKGYHTVIHYGKPVTSPAYMMEPMSEAFDPESSLRERYQRHSFIEGFHLLSDPDRLVIMDRFHLGEVVYSPRYRNYDGSYVFELERRFEMDSASHVKLILLVSSNLDIMVDDGKSHDFSRREEEQNAFMHAYAASIIPNKVLIDVYDPETGGYKESDQILFEALAGEDC